MDISEDIKRRVWEKARAVDGYDDTRYLKMLAAHGLCGINMG